MAIILKNRSFTFLNAISASEMVVFVINLSKNTKTYSSKLENSLNHSHEMNHL